MRGPDVLLVGEVAMTPEKAMEMRGQANLPPDFGEKWRGSRSGRCAILANGPSLPSSEDLARIDCPIVGINRSFLRRASDIHVVVDKMHVGSYGHMLKYLMPDALCFTRYAAPRCWTPMRLNYHLVKHLGTALLPDIVDAGWVRVGAGMAALQVAVWLGFDEVIFCGLDLRHDGQHFYDEPSWMVDHLADFHASVLEMQVDYLRRVRPELDRRGIRVISTTMDAGENTLTKIMFDAFWPREEEAK